MHMRRIAALTLLAAAPCFAAVQWAGDFETGNLNQWTKVQEVSPDRLQIVADPVRQGKYALKVTVKQGDNPINASGNRNEVLKEDGSTTEGSEAFYKWDTMFADDFPSAKTWQLFAQWHQPEDCCGSPPIQFQVYGEELQLTVSTAETLVWRAPLVRGVWHEFVLHAKFSDDPHKGFVELWYDGKKVLEKTYAATRANGYLKMGLYRANTVSQTGVLYQDGMIRGQALEDVMPPAATPPADQPPASNPPATSPTASNSPASNPVSTPPTTAPSIGSSDGPVAGSGGSAGGGCSAIGTAPAAAMAMLGMGALLRRRRRAKASAR